VVRTRVRVAAARAAGSAGEEVRDDGTTDCLLLLRMLLVGDRLASWNGGAALLASWAAGRAGSKSCGVNIRGGQVYSPSHCLGVKWRRPVAAKA
jgi:hypothetical protein